MKKEFWDKMFQMLGEISDEERQKSLDEHDEGRLVVTCHYYMPNRRSWPDLIGLLQATSDILEKAEIINNDRDIVSYGASRIMGVDKERPRVEITIEIEPE